MTSPSQEEPEWCAQSGCLRKVLRPFIYCDKHQDKSSTPVPNEPSDECTCEPKYPKLRNGSGHYEGCPLWYPLGGLPKPSDTHKPDNLESAFVKFTGLKLLNERGEIQVRELRAAKDELRIVIEAYAQKLADKRALEELEATICHKHGFASNCPQLKQRIAALTQQNGDDNE